MNNDEARELGFVVIGRNEGERLAACLRSLLPAGAPIVYADSNSSDGSPEVAGSYGALVVRLNTSTPMNASRGRHEGYRALKQQFGPVRFVQFVDGDCILTDTWIRQALLFMRDNPEAAVVCGRRFEANPGSSFYNRLCDEEWNTACGLVQASGGDALMRSTALDEVGDFDPSLMASEEPELAARLREAGWQIWRIDEPMTEHDARIYTFRAYWRRSMRAGFGYAQAWKRTAGLQARINGRLLASSLAWMFILPFVVLITFIFFQSLWVLLLLPLAYTLQIARMAARKGLTDPYAWKSAAVVLGVKSAELIGAVRALVWTHGQDAIKYKES
jgi:cellulose synthase/poly-beta-1,6-N-acetylglucosamine synthase-like glycosyltransferase